jgi:peptide deformylase
MILPIYVYGSDVLREKAEEIDINKVDKNELKQLVLDMFETMKNADGVGLAAPQIGRSIRLLIVNGSDIADSYPYLKNFKRVMINPIVLRQSEETMEYSEGCLSIPDVNCDIVRPKKIVVSFFDENLEKREEEFDEFACRMVQHEMDHLDGVVFVDRAAPIRKKIISSKLHNISKGKVKTAYKIKLEKE